MDDLAEIIDTLNAIKNKCEESIKKTEEMYEMTKDEWYRGYLCAMQIVLLNFNNQKGEL